MAYRKLNLDRDKINQCRDLAARIVKPAQKYIDRHSTISIESSCLFALGIEGVWEGKPIADLICDRLDRDRLRRGIIFWFGAALAHTGLAPREVAHKLVNGELAFETIPHISFEKIKEVLSPLVAKALQAIKEVASQKKLFASRIASSLKSPILLLVAPENERERDICLTLKGADIILTTNLKDIRADHLRKKGGELKRFATSISGLSAPQDVIRASFTGMDIIGCDTIGEIVKSGMNPKRVLVDSHWICRLCSKMGIIFFAENAHTRDLDGYRDTHQATVSQFLVEQLAFQGRIVPEQLALGHFYDIDPALDAGFLFELARAAMIRDFYPRNPLVYLPPSRFLTGSDVEKTLMANLFFSSSVITEQSIVALPNCADLSGMLKSANTIIRSTRTLGDELQFIPNGKIDRRANTILENAVRLLRKMETQGFLNAFAHGLIAGIHVDEKGGAGLDGVFQKDRNYFNPIEEYLDGKTTSIEPSVATAEKEVPHPDLSVTPTPPKKEQQRRRHFPGRYHRRRRNPKSTRKIIEKTKGTNYPPRNE